MIKETNYENIKHLDATYNDNSLKHYLAYFNKNKVIGFIEYNDLYEKIDIVNVYVEKHERRKKIASKLLEELIKISKLNNKENITLEVSIENNPAIKLYEKYNFKKVAIRKGYYKGKDGYLMELML